MTRCKMNDCPYAEKGFCSRRVTVINEQGLCAFLYRGVEIRQRTQHDNYEKNIIELNEITEEQKMIKTVCETIAAILAVCMELGLCALVIYDVWKMNKNQKESIEFIARLDNLNAEDDCK